MNRTDRTADDLRNYVEMAEAKFNRTIRGEQNMLVGADLVIVDNEAPLPDDFAEASHIETGTRLRRLTAHSSAGEKSDTFRIAEGKIVFPRNLRETAAKLWYWFKIPTITADDADTNWLLGQHPDVYLYLSMMEAALDMQDNERVQSYGSAFQGAYEALQRDLKRRRQSVAMRVRVG